MTARALLEELRQAGLSISVTAEGLRVDGPAAVREAFREKIRTHKQELIDAIHDEARQLKDRARRLKVARIREIVRERWWTAHLEQCRHCKPARPNCPNGRWMWGQYQSAIRNVVEIVKMPESPMDDRGLGHLPSCGDIESCAGPSPVAPVDGSDGEWVEIVLTPDNPPKPTDDGDKPKPICRCGSSDYVDHPIHGGQSLRRDCARCGRFIGFPVWYGVQRPVAGLDKE